MISIIKQALDYMWCLFTILPVICLEYAEFREIFSMALSRNTFVEPDTRERLLDAAEGLFGEHGFKGTSLRTITDRADANVASVNYHFGSKLELLKAVLLRAYGYVSDRQLELLEEASGAPDNDSLRGVVCTMVRPFFELSEQERERMQMVSRLMGRLLSMRDAEVRHMIEEKNREIEAHYLEALRTILAGIPVEELRWRYRSCMRVVIHDQTSPMVEDYAEPGEEYQQERLINFIEAAMLAPSTFGSVTR